MAHKPKVAQLAKFGGTDNLGEVKFDGHQHEAASVEAQSSTSLQMDKGEGDAVIVRCFTFAMNGELMVEHQPTKQDLLNAHLKGIEISLWKDGLKIWPDVPPRIEFNLDKRQYTVFVTAKPQKGQILQESTLTLSELANG